MQEQIDAIYEFTMSGKKDLEERILNLEHEIADLEKEKELLLDDNYKMKQEQRLRVQKPIQKRIIPPNRERSLEREKRVDNRNRNVAPSETDVFINNFYDDVKDMTSREFVNFVKQTYDIDAVKVFPIGARRSCAKVVLQSHEDQLKFMDLQDEIAKDLNFKGKVEICNNLIK